MKIFSLAIYSLALLVLAAPIPSLAKQEKVTICHKGKNKAVPEPALGGHLGHGDTLGPCSSVRTRETQQHIVTVPPVVQHRETVTYHYLFYPQANVYFDSGRKLYFYQEQDRWLEAAILPAQLVGLLGSGIEIEQAANSPQSFHLEVIQRYAPPQVSIPPSGQVVQQVYHYRYYPDAEVYFDEGRQVYFYQQNGQWISAPNVRNDLAVRLESFTTLDLATPQPYQYHQQIITKTPGQSILHAYQFYPSSGVYYDESRQVYFYQSNGQWQDAQLLPPNLQLNRQEVVQLEFDTDRPYLYHSQVSQRYSGGHGAVTRQVSTHSVESGGKGKSKPENKNKNKDKNKSKNQDKQKHKEKNKQDKGKGKDKGKH